MSILDLLGLGRPAEGAGERADELGRIAARMDDLEPQRARLVAAFAVALARVARADLEVDEAEVGRMEEIVRDFGAMPPEEAKLVVEMAVHLDERGVGTQDYLATRELRRLAGPEERSRILHCLFAVCAADDSISLAEEEEVRQVASELGFELEDYTRARSAFRDKREVLRGLGG